MSTGAAGGEPAGFDAVHAILRDAIAARATPGAQLAVRFRARDGRHRRVDLCDGALGYEPPWSLAPATLATPYDLASVTKALVALAVVRAASRGGLDLGAPLARFVPGSADHGAGRASLEALASHRAELPAWQPYFRAVTPERAEAGGTRDVVLADVARTALEPCPGQARYSDVGYILLGEAVARATGTPLGALVEDQVTSPLGLAGAIAYRSVRAADRDPRVAPTESCAWRGRVVQGNVHDENAYALEGVSGHAGLFGTASAVADVGEASLRALEGDGAWFARAWMEKMVAPRAGGTHRLGWDGRSDAGSSAGARMSRATFGHLGFTGTSVWCDPEARVVVALVTNRVHPSRENLAIRALRVAVHDAVMAAVA